MGYKDSILFLAKKVLLEDENIHILLKRANLKCESEGSNKCFAMYFVNENSVFSRASAKAEHDLSSLSCMCVYVDHFWVYPPPPMTPSRTQLTSHTPSPGNHISTGNSLISSPNLDSPQKFSLD